MAEVMLDIQAVALAAILSGVCALPAAGEPGIATTYNTYGYPGLIDMPSAHSRPDAELALNVSHFRNTTRTTLTFQITPRLSGSFRYSNLYELKGPSPGAPVRDFIYDRSFSLHYRFLDETRRRPAVAVGLNDFFGTGIYQSEYLVASKTVHPSVRVTGGIGWGRLGSAGSFRNLLSYVLGSRMDTRPGRLGDEGSKLEAQNWFRGPAALFGGVEWQASDRLKLTAEYSSDVYPQEDGIAFERRIPVNMGATYRLRPGAHLSLNYLHGSELGVNLSLALNPKDPPNGGARDKAPPPVVARTPDAAQLGWAPKDVKGDDLSERATRALAAIDLELHSLRITGDTARVVFRGTSRTRSGQDIGRTARVLTGILPPAIETFEIVPMVSGLTPTQVTLNRSDLEALEYEFDSSWSSYARARIDSLERVVPLPTDTYPIFRPGFGPYLQPALFDPDEPVRLDFGIEARATLEPARGLIFRGAVRKRLVGNLDGSTRPSDSVLPHVRSDFALYDREGDPAIIELTGAQYFQPSRDLYGRVTLGYLEPMFGGLSAELLWKPLNSRFGFGVELNYVRQRDFNQLFGFRDYRVPTGHATGYWQFDNGYHLRVDAGRYLAGDWGTTIALDREFKNGWKVGAFATFTNVSASEFGEGSFDKGIVVTIPIDWISGEPTRDDFTTVLRPVQRDGGARLEVAGRLYETVRGLRGRDLQNNWGRFWR